MIQRSRPRWYTRHTLRQHMFTHSTLSPGSAPTGGGGNPPMAAAAATAAAEGEFGGADGKPSIVPAPPGPAPPTPEPPRNARVAAAAPDSPSADPDPGVERSRLARLLLPPDVSRGRQLPQAAASSSMPSPLLSLLLVLVLAAAPLLRRLSSSSMTCRAQRCRCSQRATICSATVSSTPSTTPPALTLQHTPGNRSKKQVRAQHGDKSYSASAPNVLWLHRLTEVRLVQTGTRALLVVPKQSHIIPLCQQHV